MLARTPLTEIEAEDIGTVRPLNIWQMARIKARPRPQQSNAHLAFACGMSVKQFKHLPADKQDEIIKPGCPQQNGSHERLTLKLETPSRPAPTSCNSRQSSTTSSKS